VKGLAWLIVVGFCLYASHVMLAGNWMAQAGLALPAGLGGR
jgi:hypothetical protein